MPTKNTTNKNKNNSKMGSKTSTMSLRDLLIIKTQSLYDVEHVLVKALPKMAKKSSDPDLKIGFEKHLQETEGHIRRLEQVFSILRQKPKKQMVEAIRGLVADADWLMKEVKKPEALDAGIIAAAQYVEHYEIAGYGSAAEWARALGYDEVESLLRKTLEEEKNADETLNDAALLRINERALPSQQDEEENKQKE